MRINLMIGIFWLCAGATLLGARALGKPIKGVFPDSDLLFGVAALVFAAYKFARWWSARVRQKIREANAAEPPKKRPVERPPAEYHPEFDFTRNDSPPNNGPA